MYNYLILLREAIKTQDKNKSENTFNDLRKLKRKSNQKFITYKTWAVSFNLGN